VRPLRRAAGLPSVATSRGGFLTPKSEPLPIDPGLLERFLDAEQGIEWKHVETPPRPVHSRTSRRETGAKAHSEARARLAYYHDETARIEERTVRTEEVLTVTSGPVGALVLVGECARRGVPTSLESKEAGELPGYPEGAIEAHWDANSRSHKLTLPFRDVVELARYALA
jgi:hypothetical protein